MLFERVDAADLAPRLVAAGDDQRDDRAQRERGVPRQHRAELVDVGPRQHRDAEHHEATEPARHRRDVHDVGRNREPVWIPVPA